WPACLANHSGPDGPIFSKDVSVVHTSGLGAFSLYIEPDLWDDGFCIFYVADIQPHVLKAKASQNVADNPSYSQVIHSPDADKWWEAMESE
ncbi:hypothetical protein ACHAW6_005323, partial [Cyclotella cf. meneghiniana]